MEEFNIDLIELLTKSVTTTDGTTKLLNILTIITIVLGATKTFVGFFIMRPIIWFKNILTKRLIPINRISFNERELNTVFSN